MTYRRIHVFIGSDAKHHADITKEGGNDHTLDDDQFQDAPGLSTDGFADTKFMRTFLDGDEHDI